jgi:hypothetical protein
MLESLKAWGATTLGVGGWWASMNLATDVLQFATALLAFISTGIGLWLFLRKARQP